MKPVLLLIFVFVLTGFYVKAQDSLNVKVYKGRHYVVMERDERLTLYKRVNKKRYYFSVQDEKKLHRVNYYRIIHHYAQTYQQRENCRELRRRKIKLYEKYKDGHYYIFKVFNSFIQ